jgi:hypothetical protein
VSSRTEMCHGEQKCVTENINVSRRTEICHGEQKCVTENINVSRRTEMCHGEQKCVTENRTVSRRTEMCHGQNKSSPYPNAAKSQAKLRINCGNSGPLRSLTIFVARNPKWFL